MKDTVFIMCLLLVMPTFSLAEENNKSNLKVLAYEHFQENENFNHDLELFNAQTNKEIKVEGLSEEEAQEKEQAQEREDKGEGQIKVKF